MGTWCRAAALACCLLALPAGAGTAADEPVPGGGAPERQALLEQWLAFCDELKASGQRILELDRGDPRVTAEGFHYLAMLTGMAVERIQGYGSQSHPVLSRNLDNYKKMGLDSADNTYRMVRFEPGGEYRIRGRRGNSSYLGFQVNSGISAVGNLNDSQIRFEEDGSFEVYLGGEERDGNWLSLAPGADSMYVREIFIDWEKEEPSTLWIERLDLEGPPQTLTPELVGGRLQQMSAFVARQLEFWNGYVERSRRNTNVLPAPRGTTSEGGSSDNLYSGGYFKLAADEALLIETDAVPALFWNVQLGNTWFQSLDYQYRQTSLNSAQAHRDGDGRYRVVIAHEDPGVPNWLDTAGRGEGLVYYRWNRAEVPPPKPRVSVVPFAELRGHFPENTPRVTAQQRETVLQQRYRDVARRFGL